MGKKRIRMMTDAEFREVREKQPPITDELILRVAAYKVYWNLADAMHRTRNRPEYKAVEYKLGIYNDGLINMLVLRPDLYMKTWDIVKKYIEHGYDKDFSPTIHRKNRDDNYEWGTIDILTTKDHVEEDVAKMQGALIMRETDEKYEIIGLEMFSSKKEFAQRLGINEKMIYSAKEGQVVKIDNIVIQFQDVIKKKGKPITKEEILEKLDHYAHLIKTYDNAGLYEQRDRYQKLYDIWKNTGIAKGFFKEGEAI